jgi:hypothetical protein
MSAAQHPDPTRTKTRYRSSGVKSLAILLSAAMFAGCHGPLYRPMPVRLDVEQQIQVDQVWRNMLTPPERLDHTLLLDTIITMHANQVGVDHIRMISEKDRVNDGIVIMEMRFDRERPERDEYTLRYIGASGEELRHERYTRAEIEERVAFLWGAPACGFSEHRCSQTQPSDLSECESQEAARQAAREARVAEILAATQPASAPAK